MKDIDQVVLTFRQCAKGYAPWHTSCASTSPKGSSNFCRSHSPWKKAGRGWRRVARVGRATTIGRREKLYVHRQRMLYGAVLAVSKLHEPAAAQSSQSSWTRPSRLEYQS